MHYSNGSSKTVLMFRVTSNFSSSGEEFTCHFNNSAEDAVRKSFRISLKSGFISAGVYVGVAIAIAVFFVLLGLLLRSIHLHKVFILIIQCVSYIYMYLINEVFW